MTENNIFQELEADLQNQRYEELWQRYGKWIVSLALIAVLATGGISFWRSSHVKKNQEATDTLFKILEKTDKSDVGKEMGDLEKFALANHEGLQKVIAQLDAASMAANMGNTDRAVQLYDEVAKDSSVDNVYRQLADLMAVRVQMDTGDVAQLQKRLYPLLGDDSPWHYSAREYSAFLDLRAGDKEKAQRIFAELSEDARVPETLSTRAADMLHYLSE